MSAAINNATIQEALQRAKQLAQTARTDETGVKRPAEEDFNENPPKRSTNGNGNGHDNGLDMAGNPIATLGGMAPNLATMPGISDPVLVEQFEVPDHTVGLIIGRGGEQITNIQQTSGCRVQMSPDAAPGRNTRPCTLQGTKSAIDKAKDMIMSVINRSGGRPPPQKTMSFGGGAGNVQAGPGQITDEMLIPGPKCGLVIGKGGETIKQIQDKAGVKIILIQDNQQASNMPKPLRIIGEPDKVAYAHQLVEEVMNSKEDHPPHHRGGGGGGFGGGGNYNNYGGGGGMRSIGEVIVPRSSVGIIIGKGGEQIKKIGQESGAKVQFKQDEDQSAPERTAVIQGTPDQIQRATQLISELVNKSNDGGDVFFMHIPTQKTGLVIGRGGETIKQITAESGAHVELSREPPPNPQEKVFVIRGSPQSIQHAQHIIRIKVGDIPPGTPFEMQGGGGGGRPDGGGFNNFNQGGGWGGGQGQGGYPPQDPQWAAAAYYQQQYGQQPGFPYPQGGGMPGQQPQAPGQPGHQPQPMQQPQQVPQAPAAAPAVSAAPAINPQTGQPDYSAQWAEYYRSMGMHDQAAMIEQQAKANAAASVPQTAAATPGAPQMNYQFGQQGGAPQYNYGSTPGQGAAPAPQPGYQFPQQY